MACILGIIWGAFWGSLASVKLVFRVGKTSSGDCLGVPCQHFVRTCFQRAPRKHFYGFWIRSGFNLGTIFNKLGTLLGFWFRDRKKLISRCIFGRDQRHWVTHQKIFSGPEKNLITPLQPRGGAANMYTHRLRPCRRPPAFCKRVLLPGCSLVDCCLETYYSWDSFETILLTFWDHWVSF
jgi:hypothetical protein